MADRLAALGPGALLDALGGFGAVLDLDLRVTEASSEARDALGEPAGRPCYQAFKGRSHACDPCLVHQAIESGKQTRGEEVFRDRAGADWRVYVAAAPLRSPDGELAGVVVTEESHQVHELKRELAEHQEACHTLFEEVPCYVSVQDRDLRVIHANRKFREAFLDQRSRVGDTCYRLYKHRSEPCLGCPVAATFEDGSSHTSEEVVVTRDGQPANVLVVTAPIRDAAGQVEHVMEMSTNITDLRRTQSQLEALGMLVGQIAHEVKGVLTGLDGGVYLVSTGIHRKDEGRLSQGWQMVRRNVDRVRSLVLDILYYAKDRKLEFKLASPLRVAEEVLRRFEPKAAECGIRVVTNLDPAAIRFDADVRAVEALLTNLLENALDACRSESAHDQHTVGLTVRDEAPDVVFEVSDDGVGMDQEARGKVFTPFFSSKGSAGTGLGLYIAHRIASQHRGSLAVQSTLGQGSCFSVRLPKQQGTHRAGSAPAA